MNNFDRWKAGLNTDDFYEFMSIDATPCRECPAYANDGSDMYGEACRACFEAWATSEEVAVTGE